MCRLAAQGKPWLELSDIEMRREGKSYTAETLEELSVLYPQDQFYLLMGEDMFLTLGRWYRPETIFSLASVCTTPRSPDGLDALRQKALEYTGQFQARCFLEHIPYLPISSTQVRQAVARGGGRQRPGAPGRGRLYEGAGAVPAGVKALPAFGGSYAH